MHRLQGGAQQATLSPTDKAGSVAVTDFSLLSSAEIADRIAILHDNIRQITEQAASASGAADEQRNAERLARQTEELESLLEEQRRRRSSH
jgi:uncharacterized small protein (DUF1192 family)